jgi:hypothetical protein
MGFYCDERSALLCCIAALIRLASQQGAPGPYAEAAADTLSAFRATQRAARVDQSVRAQRTLQTLTPSLPRRIATRSIHPRSCRGFGRCELLRDAQPDVPAPQCAAEGGTSWAERWSDQCVVEQSLYLEILLLWCV